MFCRKCGAQLPDDSDFCSKCGASTGNSVSLNKNLPAAPTPQSRPQSSGMTCRSCMKPLTTKWRRCPYCDMPNPFYIAPEPQEQPKTQAPPQPQVIIQEREIIKPEEPGCATYIGKFIIGAFLLSLLGSILTQCGA